MKKSIILSAFVISAFAANAQTDQTALQGTKIGDNWSIEFKAGYGNPFDTQFFF